MNPSSRRTSREVLRALGAAAAFSAAALAAPRAASAQVTATWVNAVSGNWMDGGNWSTNPEVPDNDISTTFDVEISATGSAYTIDLADAVSIDTLILTSPDATLAIGPGGTLTLTTRFTTAGQIVLNGGFIDITDSVDGLAAVHGTGTFTHMAGSFNFGPLLSVGVIEADHAYYALSGTAVLSGGQLNVGANVGDGTFLQDGGSVQLATYLALGDDIENRNSCIGIYNLNAGTIASPIEYVGYSATGTFTQSGGLNAVTDPGHGLYLAMLPGSSGTYNLGGGTLNTGNTVVGYEGAATFNQSGGAATVDGLLRIGRQAGGSGTYLLSGDGSLTSGIPFVGYFGAGTFIQSGGEHHVNAAMFIGNQSGSSGYYALSAGTLSIAGSEQVGTHGAGTLEQSGGVHTIGGGLVVAAETDGAGTVILSGGTLLATNLINNGTFMAGGAGIGSFVNVAGTGSLGAGGTSSISAASIRQSQLMLAENAIVTVRPNGTNAAICRIGTISFDTSTPTAQFDLNDNDLLTQTDISAVRSMIASARNGGAWDAGGITSTAARTQINHATTFGTLSGDEYLALYPSATFGVLPVASGDTLVKYTWYGDTDFNGVVNFDDYVRTDNGFNNGLGGWLNGDFDYNGVVNFDDYVLIDLAFNVQSGTLRRALAFVDGSDRSLTGMDDPALRELVDHFQQFGEAYASQFASAVPEPVEAGMLMVGVLACLRRFAPRRYLSGPRGERRTHGFGQ